MRPLRVLRRVSYSKATAPELAGKIQAEQSAGRLDIDLVLTGTDGLSAGIAKSLGCPCCRTTPAASTT